MHPNTSDAAKMMLLCVKTIRHIEDRLLTPQAQLFHVLMDAKARHLESSKSGVEQGWCGYNAS